MPLSRFQRAFTVLELLVAIALMALFIAIFFTVAKRVSGSMNQTKNVNHLKQLGMACLLYAHDHNRTFPLYGSPGNRQNTCAYSLESISAPVKLMAKGTLVLGQGTHDYITDPEVFYSPHAERMKRERQKEQLYFRPGSGYLIGYVAISLPKSNDMLPHVPLLVPGVHNERLEDGIRAPLYCDFLNTLADLEEFTYDYCTFVLTDGSVGRLPQSELKQSWAKNILKMAGR